MNFLSLIESKRDGRALTAAQIREAVADYTRGKIPDYQMVAFLMAVHFRGLDRAETAALTLAMRDSGDMLRFPKDPRPLVDKHSTGGVGDKVSLPLTPLLACLGFRVPMISGRGLGITGGTLDKLESIPGFQTNLSAERIIEIVQKVGCVICGQTDHMVPADQRLYALRDVTGTVPSIPLIVASILSKKLAENLQALVLDVKFGCAAFMQTKADARKLARTMVGLANECGLNTRAILTDMNTPLGRAAGNWLEVKEAVACLDARPGAQAVPRLNDLRTLVIECAAHLLVQAGKAESLTTARNKAADCLASGEPRRKWDQMLVAQCADLDAFNRKLALDSTAKCVLEVKSKRTGFVFKCDARGIGETIRDLGGGRLTKDSKINHEVGVDSMLKPGERVKKNAVLARIHASDRTQARSAATRIQGAFVISDRPPAAARLIAEIVSAI